MGEAPADLVEQALVPSCFLRVPLVRLGVQSDQLWLVRLSLEGIGELMRCFDSSELDEEVVAHIGSSGEISAGLIDLRKDRYLSVLVRFFLEGNHLYERIRILEFGAVPLYW